MGTVIDLLELLGIGAVVWRVYFPPVPAKPPAPPDLQALEAKIALVKAGRELLRERLVARGLAKDASAS